MKCFGCFGCGVYIIEKADLVYYLWYSFFWVFWGSGMFYVVHWDGWGSIVEDLDGC